MTKYFLIAIQATAMAQVVPYQAEGFPSDLVARLQVRDRFLKELPASPQGFSPQYIVETLKRWNAGDTVRVAFNGGSNELRKAVADAAIVWLPHGNISWISVPEPPAEIIGAGPSRTRPTRQKYGFRSTREGIGPWLDGIA